MADDRIDDCKKILDSGWAIILYRNGLGTYTAAAMNREKRTAVMKHIDKTFDDANGSLEVVDGRCMTDDFEPSKSIYRVTEKVFGRIVDSREAK